MSRLNSLSLFYLLFVGYTLPSYAASVNLGYVTYDQEVPLYSKNEHFVMRGLSVSLAHSFNKHWSLSLYHQETDNTEGNRDNWWASAEQKNMQVTVNYLWHDYAFSFSVSDMEFNLHSSESVDFSPAKSNDRYGYVELIESTSFSFSVSRDIDLNDYWLTVEGGVSAIDQTASFNSRIVSSRKDNKVLTSELTEQDNYSWVFNSSVLISSIYSWQDIAIAPSIGISYSNVFAGDDSYFINSTNGQASRTQTINSSNRLNNNPSNENNQSQGQEPASGNGIWGLSAAVSLFVNEQLSFDLSFNRQYGDNSSDNYISAGIGWQF